MSKLWQSSSNKRNPLGVWVLWEQRDYVKIIQRYVPYNLIQPAEIPQPVRLWPSPPATLRSSNRPRLSKRKWTDHSILCCATDLQERTPPKRFPFLCWKVKTAASVNLISLIRPTESAVLSWDSFMLCVCALPDLIAFLRQNGVRFPPPPCATTCISPDFSPGGNRHSKLEKTHKSGQSNARNLCTEKKPRAQKAPIYGPSELSLFAEE